jgi:hypothetical protein
LKLDLNQQTLVKLREKYGGIIVDFLGFKLNTEQGELNDEIAEPDRYLNDWAIQTLATLLTHYSEATLKPLSGKLVKYRDLPGGCAYEEALTRRAIEPIAMVFGEAPQGIVEAARHLGGRPQMYGDASVEIMALKGIPLTYVVWGAEDFPASASLLFDETASHYLPTEDLAVLGEVTSIRLMETRRLGKGHL